MSEGSETEGVFRVLEGVFLVLEGVDGCGKSTQADRLRRRIEREGRKALHVREPGGTPAGERIRELLLDRATGDLAPIAEVFLYQAARAQLVRDVLRPTLQAGTDVVCERWHYATRAYQGVAFGAGVEAVDATSALATGGLEPARALLLDLPQREAGERLGAELDRIEVRGEDYRTRVADALRDLFAQGGERFRIVSAEGSIEDVEARVWEAVRDLFV